MSITRLFTEGVLVLLWFNGLRVVLGVPPVAYWFRSRSCPTCNGVGHVKKIKPKPGTVTVTRNGKSLDIDVTERDTADA